MKLSIVKPRQALNKAYLKEKLGRAEIELFKRNFLHMLERINEQESEEHGKNIVSDFFKNTWYKENYEINTKDRKDLVIHTGKTAKEPVGVILEVKKPGNKAEMMSADKPNTKAFHELILYYLRERIDGNNKFIRNLIITNIVEWYIIDEIWFEKYIYGNVALKKEYEEFKLSGKPTHFFYDSIAKPFLDKLDGTVPCTYVNILEYKRVMTNGDKVDDNKLIPLYKILSPVHLLKEKFANDSNTLDKHFYEELLHIIGLEEIKDGSKKLINRKKHPQEGSLLENTIIKIEDRDLLRNIKGISVYGTTTAEQTYNVALELSITWINRILFLKLLEAQLAKYHKNAREYLFLNSTFIHDFDELSNLFFGVLAEKQDKRRAHLRDKYKHVPYLNSSLFERTELERQTFDISALDNQLALPLAIHTVLKDGKGRRIVGSLTTLQYLFRFLDSYDFSSEGAEEIQEENKNLINASVLGLIFEKINGYKDGSFFTPGFVTMYMCRETIRRAVYEKFNAEKGWQVDSMNDLHAKINDKAEANQIINKLTICDPAVGSGHFLVSALNELIAIKSELRILTDSEGKTLRDCEIEVVNDELIVIDEGHLFEYNPHSKESRRIQETLFREKQTIIENCLFGVDINPNSVKICRLRLWIELLKNAYYTSETAYTQLETLPNIDINIKSGNSLVSRFVLDADLGNALKSIKWNIATYQGFVRDYKNATDKEEKRGLEDLIEKIKKDFRSEIGKSDPKIKKLAKFNSEHFEKYQANKLFDANLSTAQKKDKKKLEDVIAKLTTEIDEIKSNKIYDNAFEWRFEFPEVLDDEGHFIGFDIVIGNPPYVQLQKLQEADKDALERQQFQTYTKTGDIYQLFYEQGVKLLKPNGHLCYITSNKWMRTDYGKTTRQFLGSKCNPVFIVDFGMAQMFGSATTYTNILLIAKEVPDEHISMCRIKDDYDLSSPLNEYIRQNLALIDNPEDKSWIAYGPEEYNLIKRIESKGMPLKDWDIHINYGLKTGLNEAFIIDTECRNRLVEEDPKSAEIIRPILRGEDIKPFVPNWAGKWLINSHNGVKSLGVPPVNVERDYPAVYRWLERFKDPLIKRQDKGDHWTNLRNCAYVGDFDRPKIIYPNMTKYLPFVYDNHQFYFANDKAFILTGNSLEYLTAFLNSKLFKFAFKDYFPELLGDTREVRKVFFETIPIMPATEEIWFKEKLELICENKMANLPTYSLEKEIDDKLFDLYELTENERSLVRSVVDLSTVSDLDIISISSGVSA